MTAIAALNLVLIESCSREYPYKKAFTIVLDKTLLELLPLKGESYIVRFKPAFEIKIERNIQFQYSQGAAKIRIPGKQFRDLKMSFSTGCIQRCNDGFSNRSGT